MKAVTTNTAGERTEYEQEVQQLENFVSGVTYDDDIDSDEMIEKVTAATSSKLNEINLDTKLNREQRRSIRKKMGKKGRQNMDVISDTARKLNYIDLIQKLRKLNAEREKEDYENSNQNN